MLTTKLFLPMILVFVAALVVIKLLTPLAQKVGLMDVPGGRKLHHQPTVLIGGIAIFIAFCFGCLLLNISLAEYRVFFVLAAVMVFVGVLDDFHELSARFRLIIQILVGVLMVVWGHNSLQDLGNIIFAEQLHLNLIGQVIISVCAVIGVVNAINMLDGIDGLVSSLVSVQLGFFIYLAISNGLIHTTWILMVLIVGVLGFWSVNFPFPWRKHANAFMGDAGSMFLGFALVWFAIYLSQEPHRAASPVTFLWILLVPLYDMCTAMLRRIFHGKSPMKADREHLHHLLKELGLSKLAIVVSITVATGVSGLIGVWSYYTQLSNGIMFIIFIILGILYCVGIELLWKKLWRR